MNLEQHPVQHHSPPFARFHDIHVIHSPAGAICAWRDSAVVTASESWTSGSGARNRKVSKGPPPNSRRKVPQGNHRRFEGEAEDPERRVEDHPSGRPRRGHPAPKPKRADGSRRKLVRPPVAWSQARRSSDRKRGAGPGDRNAKRERRSRPNRRACRRQMRSAAFARGIGSRSGVRGSAAMPVPNCVLGYVKPSPAFAGEGWVRVFFSI